MLTIRDISTPNPVNVLIVTKDTKKEDIRGREFPSISNADSGVAIIIAKVSNTDPAIEVTKNTFNTCHIKYRENAFICASLKDKIPSSRLILMNSGGKSC